MQTILITGVAGFIGVNAAVDFARRGFRVVGLDNLSRRGAAANLEWARSNMDLAFHQADIRDRENVERIVAAVKPDVLLHLAGQVAVTTSVQRPREDFEINVLGSLNLLEAVRLGSPGTFFLYASTNKVYGDLSNLGIEERDSRYAFRSLPFGVSEDHPLSFHSPYGCSKGAADQYVLDYHKSYGLKTTCFRQSCIYGPRQFGIEDQGWLAWFVIASELGRPITIYGDGKQVRDALYVGDLVRGYAAAIERRDAADGRAFNIGGGPENALSLLELVARLRRSGSEPPVEWASWRVGDQRVFVSDNRRAKQILDWSPTVSVDAGIGELQRWVAGNRSLF